MNLYEPFPPEHPRRFIHHHYLVTVTDSDGKITEFDIFAPDAMEALRLLSKNPFIRPRVVTVTEMKGILQS